MRRHRASALPETAEAGGTKGQTMITKRKGRQITFYLLDRLYDPLLNLRYEGQGDERSLSQIINEALAEYLEKRDAAKKRIKP